MKLVYMEHPMSDGELLDRGTIEGFAQRVRKNTDFLARAFEQGEDVHIVTQFVISLLGLIIFPYQEMHRHESLAKKKMKELEEKEGWPQFKIIRGDEFETLGELIKHLRDAVSHYKIEFEPENERRLENITITLGWPKGRQDSRRSSISGADFCVFVRKFSRYIEGLMS
jgi:hypothetical protein